MFQLNKSGDPLEAMIWPSTESLVTATHCEVDMQADVVRALIQKGMEKFGVLIVNGNQSIDSIHQVVGTPVSPDSVRRGDAKRSPEAIMAANELEQ